MRFKKYYPVAISILLILSSCSVRVPVAGEIRPLHNTAERIRVPQYSVVKNRVLKKEAVSATQFDKWLRAYGKKKNTKYISFPESSDVYTIVPKQHLRSYEAEEKRRLEAFEEKLEKRELEAYNHVIGGTLYAYQRYMEYYPKGKYVTALKAISAQCSTFYRAKSWGVDEARAYLREYPDPNSLPVFYRQISERLRELIIKDVAGDVKIFNGTLAELNRERVMQEKPVYLFFFCLPIR